MHKHSPLALLALAVALGVVSALPGSAAFAGEAEPMVREIFVPFESLEVLLEDQPRRVLLAREEYEDLLKMAKQVPESRAPTAVELVSAEYAATVEEQRVRWIGTLVVDVLIEGLHAVPLDLSGVGLQRATLDGEAAAIGLSGEGRLELFVEGTGRHELVLQMVSPLETTAAEQVLRFGLPQPPAARFRLTVPGDVEVKSGADVVSRTFDEASEVTRLELLPRRGDTTLVMTLNSRLQRRGRAVIARSIVVDEVTEAYERLHATVSLDVLHRAVDELRFVVPEGFEFTQVSSPMLARWEMETSGPDRVLAVRLREQTTETVVLNLSAVRTSPQQDGWSFPKLRPLDVVGQVAVVGLLVDARLKASSVVAEGLIPIDIAVLRAAIPQTVFQAEPGAPALRPLVAYFAPQEEFELSARFARPPAEIAVTTNVLLVVEEQGLEARGRFLLTPKVEKLFGFDFTVPAGWRVTGVRAADRQPLSFERYGPKGEAGRIRVRLPSGVPSGEAYAVSFQAESTPQGWLDPWDSRQIEFPSLAVADAVEDVGAVAIGVGEDLAVQPVTLERLTPLDAAEKAQYGLTDASATLVYRYESRPYRAELLVERTRPRLTARTFSFVRVEPEGLTAHYEIVYQVERARTRQLALLLPEATPAALSIRGLDGVKLKEFVAEPAGAMRRWNVLLEEPRRGEIRLAVDFQQPLSEEEPKDFAIPIVAADGVAYQSGLVAIEGDPELEVQVRTDARRVDVGELVDADYRPGRGLLGAFGFVGEPVEMQIDVFRHPGYRLDPAIVQRVALSTLLSAEGVGQTAARFELRTKALYLEVQLPEGARLWSADLDGQPIKPQREDDSLLVSLPSSSAGTLRTLRIVYEDSVDAVALLGRVELTAPALYLRTEPGAAAIEVPMADLVWHLRLPSGYEVTRTGGTVRADVRPPVPAAVRVAKRAAALLFSSPLLLTSRSAREARILSPESQEALQAAAENAADDEGGVFYGFGEHGPTARGLTADSQVPAAAAFGLAREAEEDEEEDVQEMAVSGKPAAEPVTAPALPSGGPAQLIAPAKKEPVRRLRAMEGFSSLMIELAGAPEDDENVVTFESLGVKPRVEVTLASRRRFEALGWGLALAVGLLGLMLGSRPVGAKTRFVLAVIVLGTLVPVVPGWEETAGPANMAVYAASLLVPYYLLAGFVVGLVRWLRHRRKAPAGAVAATAAVLAAALFVAVTAEAAEPPERDGPYVIEVVGPPEPVTVPDDAVILPYDPESATGIEDADQMLVPYAKYVELWNLAYPDEKLEAKPPPAAYALAGASYTTALAGDEYLLVEGRLEVDVFTDAHVTIPLGLAGGVLARAELDGRPARLSLSRPAGEPSSGPPQQQRQQPSAQAANQAARQVPAPERPLIVLHVVGKGRHRVELAARLRLERRGGWRVAAGVLPWAAASELRVRVPRAETEVRFGHVPDRQSYETGQANEEIETVLAAGGAVSIQWRPKVAEGQVDRSLTVRSDATLDVQEDGLRLVWQLGLEFPRSQRDAFRIYVPEDYLVEKIEGTNVRGWEVRAEPGRQAVEVSLLKTARDRESFSLRLWRGGSAGQDDLAEFGAPVVSVGDAALESGRLTIRRSPMLELRSIATSGVTRTDLPETAGTGGPGMEESPLGIRPYEAYRFATTPFSVRLAAAAVRGEVAAEVQTVLKIAEYERSMESRVNLLVEKRPIYRVRILLPNQLELEDVSAPGEYQWALTRRLDRPLLTVYLAAGQQGEVPLVLRGKLSGEEAADGWPLPNLEVLDASRQEGQIAIQVDPAFSVQATDLENCQRVLLERLYGWLQPEQRGVTGLALHYRRPDYGGTLQLSLRTANVTCDTITNVRVTDRAVEETILLDFTIQEAGIREISFLLPAWMQDCRISVPMLRQKTIEPAGDAEDAALRVRLSLQDEVMEKLRVLVESDRLLSDRAQAAPIPVVQTGRTVRRFVALESAGRDEMVVGELAGLQRLSRQQSQWRTLTGILGSGITQAYLVQPDVEDPRLTFTLRERAAVKTAGARIGFAETSLVLDASGAYRAEQIYRLDNTTEQFLQIRLPDGARLWTARVAGDPVKPTEVPGATDSQLVQIPLIKTAAGELDYAVVLKYGGELASLGDVATVRAPLSFPLIHTVNLNVELSQVRLFLPEEYAWFDFGGTMSPVIEEDDLKADYLSYQTKVAERLVETAQHADLFSKARAANSLLSFQKDARIDLLELKSRRYDNKKLKQEVEKQAGVLAGVERQLGELEQTPDEPVGPDNREQLNALYGRQKNLRARNVVQDLGRNFDEPVARDAAEDARIEQRFNTEWLDRSKLSNTKESAEQADPLSKRLVPALGKAVSREGQKPGSQPAAQFDAAVFDRDGEERNLPMHGRPVDGPAGGGVGGRASGRRGDVASRYQEQLRQQQAEQSEQAPARRSQGWARGERGASVAVGTEAAVAGDSLSLGALRAGAAYSADAFGAVPAAQIAAGEDGVRPPGLTSLDVELPRRGLVYRFTTPGGDLKITTRAVSEKLIASVRQAALIVIAALVALWIVRLARRGRFDWLGGRIGSNVLITVGLAIFIVLPLLGLLALAGGIAAKLRRAGSASAA